MAATLLPWLGWLLVCKPTIGAALFLYRPSWTAAVGGAALLLISFLFVPSWLGDWLQATRGMPVHDPPFLRSWGWLPLVALLRWRKPEARLVAAMALVPQNLYFYDQLVLWLVPWNALTTIALTASSWVAWALTARTCTDSAYCGADAEPWIIALVYVPAVILAFLRPAGPGTGRQAEASHEG
jgi:hypothetical protein